MTIPNGIKVKIGGKHARFHSYDLIIGKKGVVVGRSKFSDGLPNYAVQMKGVTWYIRPEDTLPLENVTNEMMKELLSNEY